MKVSELFINIASKVPEGRILRFKLYGNSMSPTFRSGQVLKFKKIPTNQYKKGDVILYKSGNTIVAHRIIIINGDEVTTKGDSGTIPDEPIRIDDIIGKVIK